VVCGFALMARPVNLAWPFDNMDDRPIKGDSEWQQYAVVLDVPSEATALAYGILLSGAPAKCG
jgi:hypothetical protein